MGKALLVQSNMTTSTSLDLVSGHETNLFGDVQSTATEATAQASATEGCTFSGLALNIFGGGSGTNNLQFRDAGANGNQLATRTGTGIAEDAVNTDVLSAADLFNLAYTDTGTDSQYSWIKGNVEFASGHGAFTGCAGLGLLPVMDVESATRFFGLAGDLRADGNTTESDVAFKCRGYDVFEALQVRVAANARTNDSVFRNRINAGNGTGVITFGAGVTGLLTATGLADAITDGQTVNASLTLLTGVEDLSVAFIVATLKSSTGKQDQWSCAQDGEARAASATAEYFPIGGFCNAGVGFTEAQCQIKPGFAGVASNLRIYCAVNSYTGDGTLKLYQNGSPVITTTITAAGGAGWYENTSDTVTFDADDVFSFEIDEGTSGSITIHTMGITFAPIGGNTASPSKGTIVFTGFAPSSAVSSSGVVANPTAGVIVFAGKAPAAVTTAHVFEAPSQGSIVFAGKAPSSATTAHVFETPGQGSIVFTGQAPSAVTTANITESPDKGVIVFTGQAPTAVVSAAGAVFPDKGVIVFSGKQPTAFTLAPQVSAPDKGVIVFTGKTPTASQAVAGTVFPDKGAIVFTGKAPSLNTGIAVGKGTITFAGFAPVAVTTTGIYVYPSFNQISFAGHAPSVVGGVSPFTEWTEQSCGTSSWTTQTDGSSIWTEQFDGSTSWAEN